MQTISMVTSQSAATSFSTPGILVADKPDLQIQVSFTGVDVAGTAKVQYSIDNVNFFSTTSGTFAVTGSVGTVFVGLPTAKYMRLNWTYSSGTGNITAIAALKQFQGERS